MEWELLINLKLPHEGFMVGYEFVNPTKKDNYYTFYLHLGFITFIFNLG